MRHQKKEDRIDEIKKKPIRPAPAASTADPLPYAKSSRTLRHWKLPQHHRPTQPPTAKPRILSIFPTCLINLS